MLKVNEERLLHDHAELVEKREANLAEIEKEARIYAISRKYDEETTAQFVAFTQKLEGDGLSAEESAKLEVLATYIEDVEDVAELEAVTNDESGDALATVQIGGAGFIA